MRHYYRSAHREVSRTYRNVDNYCHWCAVLPVGSVLVRNIFHSRGKKNDVQVFDADGRQLTGMKPTFPIVGLGSLILGLILALMPNTFVQSLMYILAAILILGAISQMANLVAASRMARIGFYYWIMPALTLLIGIVAIVSPSSIASAPLFVIGWTMIVYGVVELTNAIKLHQLRRSMERSVSTDVKEDEQQPKDPNQ